MGVALTAAGVALGAGLAAADVDPGGGVQPASPGSYQNWGTLSVSDGGTVIGQGKGNFGERFDASAMGGTQQALQPHAKWDGAYVYTDYYYYGPAAGCGGSAGDTSSCWHWWADDKTDRNKQSSWFAEYQSTTLDPHGDRARGYFKVCVDRSLHSDPCSGQAILTTSY